MAFDQNKDYWWMALHEDFFATEELSYIEDEISNGNIYVLFFLKICLMSLKNKGLIGRVVADMFLPYSEVTLAKETKLDAKEVKNALSVLSRAKLIEVTKGIIYIPLVDSMVGTKKAGFKKIESEKRQERRFKAIKMQFQLLQREKSGQLSGQASDKTIELKTENLEDLISSDITTSTEVVISEEPVDNSDLMQKIEKLEKNGVRTSLELLASKYSIAELDSYIAWAKAASKKTNHADFLYKALMDGWKLPPEYSKRQTCPKCNGTKYQDYINEDGNEMKTFCSLCYGKGYIEEKRSSE